MRIRDEDKGREKENKRGEGRRTIEEIEEGHSSSFLFPRSTF
jgi:hypothetical protein